MKEIIKMLGIIVYKRGEWYAYSNENLIETNAKITKKDFKKITDNI